MRSVTVRPAEDGMKLSRYLQRLFPNAPSGLLFKQLRRKNITLNGKRADPEQSLRSGDVIEVFFSEETFAKFAGTAVTCALSVSGASADSGHTGIPGQASGVIALDRYCSIVYEDDQLIIADKKAGVLSQKSRRGDISLNEALLSYTMGQGVPDTGMFRPSVCNRLDRNTSGLVLFAKTYAAARTISGCIRERAIRKFYYAVVKGSYDGPEVCVSRLQKDEKENRVTVGSAGTEGGDRIETVFRTLQTACGLTLLEAELITGKPHQIRAQLSYLGFPVAGDPKYGDVSLNHDLKKRFGTGRQLLHAARLTMPDTMHAPLEVLSGKTFRAAVPADISRIFSIE